MFLTGRRLPSRNICLSGAMVLILCVAITYRMSNGGDTVGVHSHVSPEIAYDKHMLLIWKDISGLPKYDIVFEKSETNHIDEHDGVCFNTLSHKDKVLYLLDLLEPLKQKAMKLEYTQGMWNYEYYHQNKIVRSSINGFQPSSSCLGVFTDDDMESNVQFCNDTAGTLPATARITYKDGCINSDSTKVVTVTVEFRCNPFPHGTRITDIREIEPSVYFMSIETVHLCKCKWFFPEDYNVKRLHVNIGEDAISQQNKIFMTDPCKAIEDDINSIPSPVKIVLPENNKFADVVERLLGVFSIENGLNSEIGPGVSINTNVSHKERGEPAVDHPSKMESSSVEEGDHPASMRPKTQLSEFVTPAVDEEGDENISGGTENIG